MTKTVFDEVHTMLEDVVENGEAEQSQIASSGDPDADVRPLGLKEVQSAMKFFVRKAMLEHDKK